MEKISAKIKNLTKNNLFKSIILYTPIFGILSLFIIYIFLKYDKSFVWNSDALYQHTITLRYFRDLIIEFIRSGNISTFTWNIGLGFDLFANLAYYILGDFFSYASILFKTKHIELVYSILIFVRMYFVGITFLCYCKYKKMNKFSSVVGAIMYTFCTFVLYSAVRHPYFINVILLFPLIMIGIEKIILENKPIFYTLIIALTFIVSFYFAYMISIIIAIYGIILTIYKYKKDGIKKIIKVLLKTLLYSILGILMAFVVLLPTIVGFLTSGRSSLANIFPYSLSSYRNLVNSFLTINGAGYWRFFSVQSLVFITLPVFIRKRKENYALFILMLTLLLPLLISQIGSIFCGFNFPNNRWSFIISFLFSFITTSFINNNQKLDKKDLQSIGFFSLFYFGINILFEKRLEFYSQIQLFLLILFLLLIINKDYFKNKFKKINLYYVLLISILCCGVFSSAEYLYDINGTNYVSKFIDSGTLANLQSSSNETIKDFSKAISYINNIDNGYYKISKYPYSLQNLSLIKNYNAIGSYYSITPNLLDALPLDLDNIQYSTSQGIKEFDYRTKITTLLGVKYYIKNGENTIPYGYSLLDEYNGKSNIYANNYSLPFGVLYTNYITLDEYNSLTSLEKESTILKTTALDNTSASNIQHNETLKNDININTIKYEIIDDNKILDNNNITINSNKKNTIKLKLNEVNNGEIYIYIDGIHYTPYSKEELISLNIDKESTKIEIAKVKKDYKWYEPNYSYKITASFKNLKKSRSFANITSPYYMETSDLLFNLGYHNNLSNSDVITLNFSELGNYTFDNIIIYSVSMEDYEKDINNLKKSNFEVSSYGDGYLTATANCEESGILQFSTTYNNGWKVYVDGKEIETLVSNKYFLGIPIEKGEHTIYLKYTNPYILPGLIISVASIILFVGIIIYRKKQKKV